MLAEVDASVRRWREVGTDLGMTKIELDQFSEAFEVR